MKKSGVKMAVRVAKGKSAKKRKPAAAGGKKRKSKMTNLGAIGGPLMMKKSAAKLNKGFEALPKSVQAKIKKESDSVAKMKKVSAMKLKYKK